MWYKKLDKKLVFTGRVKRFFAILLLAFLSYMLLEFLLKQNINFSVVMPMVLALLFSGLLERIMAFSFLKKAKSRLKTMPHLRIVLVTASFGKTSIKNYIAQILSSRFNVYATPRSVNTLMGLAADINNSLPLNTQIYIAEAGARQSGDIAQISELLCPQVVVVGEIGNAHMEYFKSIDITRATKLEALQSSGLKQAFLHSSTLKQESEAVQIYNKDVREVKASLDGLSFKLKDSLFSSPLLGSFNAENLAAAIAVARYFGLDDDEIRLCLNKLKNTEHRLSKIEAGGKVIIDDSFNGNLAGMSASYALVKTHPGRKVLVTPGIVEGASGDNKALAELANDIFDVVFITGSLNAQTLLKGLKKPKVILAPKKQELQALLAKHTMPGDLILFSNDAPSFI